MQQHLPHFMRDVVSTFLYPSTTSNHPTIPNNYPKPLILSLPLSLTYTAHTQINDNILYGAIIYTHNNSSLNDFHVRPFPVSPSIAILIRSGSICIYIWDRERVLWITSSIIWIACSVMRSGFLVLQLPITTINHGIAMERTTQLLPHSTQPKKTVRRPSLYTWRRSSLACLNPDT
jgi:hypothetical protein